MDSEIKESFDDIQKICRLLNEKRTSKFDPPVTEKQISDWEKKNGITIPPSYKDWLLCTGHAYIYGFYCELFFPEVYNDGNFILIGDIIGDGECLYFTKNDTTIYRDFEGDITEYESFDEFLVDLELDLEDFAEDELGENWTEIYDNM